MGKVPSGAAESNVTSATPVSSQEDSTPNTKILSSDTLSMASEFRVET
jgi:hypothetical protein